jgi:hypothetical protein
MNLGRCPVCHSHITLEAMVQDEAGRELLGLLGVMEGDLSRALVTYLGLFRPEKRDLANDRALRLAQEVLALTQDRQKLAAALAQTVETLRAKGGGGGSASLKNHNYLKRVLENTSSLPPLPGGEGWGEGRKVTKTEQALMNLEKVKDRYRNEQ